MTLRRAYIKDVCRALGHYFPCAIDPWVDVNNVIWAGLRLADEANKQNVVYKTDQIGVKVVIHKMHKGAKEAQATDTNKVWHEILTLILENPQTDTITMPKPITKISYSFNYIDTGHLLCPQIYLSNFNANPWFLQKLADGKVEVMASYWPSFLYCQKLHKLNNIESGLLRGYLLLWVFQHIFCSTGDLTKQGGMKCHNVAKINRMHKITGHHIAYAACQDSWTKHDGAFDMDTFYMAIIDLFEEYPDNKWATATLAWWNEYIQVFSDAEGHMITTAEKQTHPPDSSVAQMAAARAAHVKAHAEAAAADTNIELGHETDDM
ncbi:hypothetical protein EV421DRAFT_1742615 [Armillaria borealis]|uniref:Uncharacterized protein n=1 Tax=Armillaria borealis TaxID=47425 RepID=A0AA39MFW1_9AGAR|nr:hypothetical protein EV421DRAFT_1742615 [Armillaria borealis]